jgi:very-short-patch-repair endonuclease
LVAKRDDRDGIVESRLESALLLLLREYGLPLPLAQYRVMEGEAFVARLDFEHPSHRLGIEADGYRWHGSAELWRRDLRRENRLKLLGWTLLRFSWEDVHDRPEIVASQVRAALSSGSVSTGGGASPILRAE